MADRHYAPPGLEIQIQQNRQRRTSLVGIHRNHPKTVEKIIGYWTEGAPFVEPSSTAATSSGSSRRTHSMKMASETEMVMIPVGSRPTLDQYCRPTPLVYYDRHRRSQSPPTLEPQIAPLPDRRGSWSAERDRGPGYALLGRTTSWSPSQAPVAAEKRSRHQRLTLHIRSLVVLDVPSLPRRC